MTTNTTPAPTGAKKLPPMVKTIREFVDAMEFPLHEHGPNPNIASASVALAMLMHGIQIESDATTATCSPSQAQVAATLHASKSYVEREMKRLHDIGLMRKKRQGDGLSCICTLFRTPQKSDSATISESENKSESATPPVRVGNSGVQIRQLPVSDSATMPFRVGNSVRPQGNTSGSSQENSQESLRASDPDVAGSPTSAQENEMGRRPVSPTGQPSPTGLVVKREGSGVPPLDACICCTKLGKKQVGGVVIRRGSNGYCQRHSGPDWEM